MILHVNLDGLYRCHPKLKIGIFRDRESSRFPYKTVRTRDLLKMLETKNGTCVFDYEYVTGDYFALRYFLPQAVLVEVFYDERQIDVFLEETSCPITIKCSKQLMDKLKSIKLS